MNNQTASKRITKRISTITIKRTVDTDPDTSYLGEYSNDAETDYAIDRKHAADCHSLEANHGQAVDQLERVISYLQKEDSENGADFTYNDDAIDILIEAQDGLQECDCSGGDMERNEYRYFNGNVENYKGETPDTIREYILRDYERMERLHRGDWCYIGIRAEAEVSLTGDVMQEVSSGGLWGIESDSSKEYFAEIEADELFELRKQLYAVGFSKRAIATACKNINREEL